MNECGGNEKLHGRDVESRGGKRMQNGAAHSAATRLPFRGGDYHFATGLQERFPLVRSERQQGGDTSPLDRVL